MLNTKQTRSILNAMIKGKNTGVWRTWTNVVQKNKEDVADRRNLCYAILGDKFTEGECTWLKIVTGCERVHNTNNGRYLRLVGVKYDG